MSMDEISLTAASPSAAWTAVCPAIFKILNIIFLLAWESSTTRRSRGLVLEDIEDTIISLKG